MERTDLQQYTYENILTEALARVPETVDKRVGSIIFDALAPACYELAIFYQNLYNLTLETYVETASGAWLDSRAAEQGLTRHPAEAAVVKGVFTFTNQAGNPSPYTNIPIGSRFSTLSTSAPLIYKVTAKYFNNGLEEPGSYELECETPGLAGGEFTGGILPLDYLPNLATANIIEPITLGQETETDDDLKERYMLKVNEKPFAGNVAAYRQMRFEIPKIGDMQVYPVWNDGGTVKLSIVGTDNLPVTDEILNEVQTKIDPEFYSAAEVEDGNSTQGLGLGLAPIDHRVTVVTPTAVAINITANVNYAPGYTEAIVRPNAQAAIEEYFKEVRQNWAKPNGLNNYSCTVYYSRIIAALLSVEGIESVDTVKFNYHNGVEETEIKNNNLVLIENKDTQQIPVFKDEDENYLLTLNNSAQTQQTSQNNGGGS
ncbi:MAG: baseplate J/gp47 family protein [Oscillospiraceae bacterium]|jgi:uncharacterized phage protein gp47/JayE|nr:baseplate J/gp47 family protein [Oscillospiraceae bacterium]